MTKDNNPWTDLPSNEDFYDNNPWPGLASYEDPSKSDRKLKFCGRDNDIYDVTRLIDDNLLLVFYGKSGIGKTSLLKAGVFPKLRLEQYLPVSLRLGTLGSGASYQEAIISAVKSAVEEVNGNMSTCPVVEEQTDNQQPNRLWNYFARHRFVDAKQQSLFPVIVLDQFEEVLRNTSLVHLSKAQTLLNQIQYLVDESHALGNSFVEGKEYFYDFNFRFVISIREDELYLLEDSIDDLSLSMFRNCRYRLHSLSIQGATEAILGPGKDCIADEEQQVVVDRIIELSKRLQSNDIDTLLLSLVCAGTYDKKAGKKITLSDLAIWKSNPMEVYYQNAIKGLTDSQIHYIQQHLIREDGSRKRVGVAEAKAALGVSSYSALIIGKNKMLSIGEHDQVELLHDQLGVAVYEDRKAFEERERKKRLRRKTTIFSIIGLFFFVISIVCLQLNRRLIVQKDILNRQNSKLYNIQASLIKSYSDIKDDSYLSRLLALEILPEKLSDPDRPCTIEAEMMLRKAASSNIGVVRRAKSFAYFIHDGKHFVTRHEGNGLLVYETATGVCIDTVEFHGIHDNLAINSNGRFVASKSVNNILLWDGTYRKIDTLCKHNQRIISVALSPDDNRIVTTSEDNMIRLWDMTGKCIDSMIAYYPNTNNNIWRVGLENATFSLNGKWIVPIVRTGYACVYDRNFNCLDTLHGVGGYNITQVGFTSNCKRIIGANVTNVLIWDWDEKKAKCIDTISLSKIQPGNGMIDYVNLSQDGNYIIICSHAFQNDKKMKKDSHYEYLLCVLDSKGNVVRQIVFENKINTAFLSHDNSIILSATSNCVRIDHLDPEEGDMLTYRDLAKSGSKSATYSKDGRTILFSNGNLLDADNGDVIWSHKSLVNLSGGYSADGKCIVLASPSTLYVCDTLGNLLLKKLLDKEVSYVTFCPDNKSVLAISNTREEVSGEVTSTMIIWDIITGDSTIKIFSNSEINHVCFSHSQPYDTFYYPPRATLFTTAKKTTNATQYATPPGKIAISSNDKYIAVQKAPSVIGIWNLDKWKTGCQDYNCGVIVRPHYGANTIAFSPDERFLLVATRASTLLYDVNTGQELMRLNPGQGASSASFSPDGRHIMSVLNGNIVRLYDFPPLQELIDQTRMRFKDCPLTQDERKMYYLE